MIDVLQGAQKALLDLRTHRGVQAKLSTVLLAEQLAERKGDHIAQ